MTPASLRDFLSESIRRDALDSFGVADPQWLEQVTNNWFDDRRNYDGRWRVIEARLSTVGKVLDMAAGCGTFVLNGLRNHRDVYGIEPEEWKLRYFRDKIDVDRLPDMWSERVLRAEGESLPFPDSHFDLVTTYQTLEHVKDVRVCVLELLRVLKAGGALYLRAPDYNSFFEPHYQLPFLPRMNKALAAKYLRALGRPTRGLENLQWTTEKDIVGILKSSGFRLTIERSSAFRRRLRKAEISALLPRMLRNVFTVAALNAAWEIGLRLYALTLIGRRENNIDLWITKLG